MLGKRPDGYHDIISVMQTISLCDVLTFERHDRLRLASDIAELVSPNNLVYKAARLMQRLAKSGHGVSISLSKGIPLASGLGGGSSDAAVTLQALNEMWDIDLPRERLMEVAAQLGSDVPFFVGGSPTALATGRGEKVEALPSPAKTWVVLLRPPIEMPNKTREMYSHLDPAGFTKGQHARRLANSIRRGGRITNRQCFNVFDQLGLSLFPGLDRLPARVPGRRSRRGPSGRRRAHAVHAGGRQERGRSHPPSAEEAANGSLPGGNALRQEPVT